MNLQYRIDLLERLGQYMISNEDEWNAIKKKASLENGWFVPEFVELAIKNIVRSFLDKNKLMSFSKEYQIPGDNLKPIRTGIVMAGNIPLVGFHDFFSVFITGNIAIIKPSSRDQVLIRHLADKLMSWEPSVSEYIFFSEMLKGCDAYIATGSNNSSRYFEYYFAKYPHVIRKNRTSVAILSGKESAAELELLADDVFSYFGLGCRNVTKIYVPAQYDFLPLLNAFRKYSYLSEHHKYKNNYDYNLALHLLNKVYYMTNGAILLVENTALFSPISQLNYEFYHDLPCLRNQVGANPELQCVISRDDLQFGSSQSPGIRDYADAVDTVKFLLDAAPGKIAGHTHP